MPQIKNNNPGNIIATDIKWRGLHPSQPAIGRFCNFVSLEYGLRAMMKNIISHQKQGNNTIQKLIGGTSTHAGWAPASDNNDVPTYLRTMEKTTGIDRNTKLDYNNLAQVALLAIGIITQEYGQGEADRCQLILIKYGKE